MILRSLTKHVKDQNWFAVAIDFLIVVVGVYIGIEVANWNEARQDHQAYLEAHDRMVEEAKRNITTANQSRNTIEPLITSVENTIEDLRECRNNQDARERMDVSLTYMNSTFAARLENSAAETLSSSERLLEQQPAHLRQRYAEYDRRLNTFIHFSTEWQQRMEDQFDDSHPFLDYGRRDPDRTQSSLTGNTSPLILVASMSEACTDVSFRKIFNRWENGTLYQVNLMNNFITFTNDFLSAIGKSEPAGGTT